MPQVVEHVTTANQGVLLTMQSVVVSSPRGDQVREFDDEDMPYIFYGGGGAAPPGLPDPSGAWTQDQAIAAFEESVRALVEWYDSVDVDLRECAVVHPAWTARQKPSRARAFGAGASCRRVRCRGSLPFAC